MSIWESVIASEPLLHGGSQATVKMIIGSVIGSELFKRQKRNNAGFEVLTLLFLKSTIFCHAKFTNIFVEHFSSSSESKIKPSKLQWLIFLSQRWRQYVPLKYVKFYQTTRHCIPEDKALENNVTLK
jgi:hypothetical protein